MKNNIIALIIIGIIALITTILLLALLGGCSGRGFAIIFMLIAGFILFLGIGSNG